jgi:hypothetical protein
VRAKARLSKVHHLWAHSPALQARAGWKASRGYAPLSLLSVLNVRGDGRRVWWYKHSQPSHGTWGGGGGGGGGKMHAWMRARKNGRRAAPRRAARLCFL